MSLLSLFFLFFSTFVVQSQQCSYSNPVDFMGETILPTTATNQLNTTDPDIYEYCTTNDAINWAEGLENGFGTVSPPEIDYHFFLCKTGLYNEPYILLDSSTGLPLDNSKGVTIGGGIDLGAFSRTDLETFGVPSSILDQLNTFLGYQGTAAAVKLCNASSLNLTTAEVLNITYTVLNNYYIPTVSTAYNNQKAVGSLEWSELAICYRTVLKQLFCQNPNLFSMSIWQHILVNDWNSVITELKTLSCSGSAYCDSLEILYYQLASIIDVCEPCSNEVDIAFLIDSSGSVEAHDFGASLQFIADLVDEVAQGTRIGLSQFGTIYLTQFNMKVHNLDTLAGREAAKTQIIYGTPKVGGGTNLANAISGLAIEQFGEGTGVRDKSELVPRVALIMTDGGSADNPADTIGELEDLGVRIIAIGIGDYDEAQLMAIANELFFLEDFDSLVDIIDQISAVSCQVSADLPESDTYSDTVEVTTRIIQRYTIQLSSSLGSRRLQASDSIIIRVRQISGCIYMYVSYCNEYPDQFNHDFAHEACDVENKILVIPYYDLNITCTPTYLNFGVEGIDSGTRNQYQVATSSCSSTTDNFCKPGANYVYDVDVMDQNSANDTIVLNSDKICISDVLNPTTCGNRTSERDCVGYFGYCEFRDAVIPTTQPTINPTEYVDETLCAGRCWTGVTDTCSCAIDCKRPAGNRCCQDFKDVCYEDLSSKCQDRYDAAYTNWERCYQDSKKSKGTCNNNLQLALLTVATRCKLPVDHMNTW